ncbi:MAG: MmpS family transport accessory protein [Acidimicrobiia bacterium]
MVKQTMVGGLLALATLVACGEGSTGPPNKTTPTTRAAALGTGLARYCTLYGELEQLGDDELSVFVQSQVPEAEVASAVRAFLDEQGANLDELAALAPDEVKDSLALERRVLEDIATSGDAGRITEDAYQEAENRLRDLEIDECEAHEITYEVTGDSTADVTYVDETGKERQEKDVELHWDKSLTVTGRYTVKLEAINQGDRPITCRLVLDGGEDPIENEAASRGSSCGGTSTNEE